MRRDPWCWWRGPEWSWGRPGGGESRGGGPGGRADAATPATPNANIDTHLEG